DGQFYFKLQDARGTVLLQSQGFASPQEAGRAIAQLQAEGEPALAALASRLAPLDNAARAAVVAALAVLAEAAAESAPAS
ncbi:DUF1508 domain-containing protein, partial [Pseudacidovorax intermedius]